MHITPEEVVETLTMVTQQNLDVRTVTLGLSLARCADSDVDVMAARVYERVTRAAERLVPVAEQIEREYGIPIVNKRISVTPIAQLAAATGAEDVTALALALDRAAHEVGVDFIGGFSALVHKGTGDGDRRLIASIPEALAATERVCASVNVATTRAGINMDAVLDMAHTIRRTAELTAERDCIGCAKLVVFANMVEDNPFMAGAVHGTGEPDEVINVGISGPGVVRAIVDSLPQGRRPHRHRRGHQGDVVQDHPRRRARRPRGRQAPRASRWASSTSRLPPRPPRATRSPRSSRRWASSAAAAPAPPPRSRCSTTPSRRAARWAPRASAASPAPSSRSPRTRA